MKEIQDKDNSGVTIITLIITIIILVILAGVSLNTVFSQDGIFSKASKSATNIEIAKIEETAQMIYSQKIMDNVENGKDSQVETAEIIAELRNLGYHIEKRPVAEGDIEGISLDKEILTIGKNTTAEIKVTYEGVEDPFIYYVEVQDKYYKIHNNKGNITIDKIELTDSDLGTTGDETENSNALKITSNPTNIITACLKEGSFNTIEIDSSEIEGDTVITVKYGNLSPKTCTVTVRDKILATGIALNKTKDVVTGGLSWTNDVQLVATITPENADNKEVKWESDNPNIATVNNNGLVKAGTIGGDVTITATTKDGTNLLAECKITTENFGEIKVDNTDYTDEENYIAKIPKGFAVGTSDNVSKISNGLVIQDNTGNQWVWIPCYLDDNGTKKGQKMYLPALEYTRTAFNGENITSRYKESLKQADSNSIKTYGGFYIGRYEAGADKNVSSIDNSRTVYVKGYKVPYNYISQKNCISMSNDFASTNGYDTDKVYTKLVSSYAWDTAINFLKTKVSDYDVNSSQGNYSDTNFISENKIMYTGLTTSVCNIYDMGGNLYEYISESYSNTWIGYVVRGGSYASTVSTMSSGSRLGGVAGGKFGNGEALEDTGFRLTLYIQ